jgi:hypothetical protein
MYATVQVSSGPARAALALRRAAPRAATTRGLAYSTVGVAAPLGTGLPRPQFGRSTLVAFWESPADAADGLRGPWSADTFEGLRIDAVPERCIGSWPGVPDGLPTSPEPQHEGPAFVMTLGRVRLLQARRFFAASARAEPHILASPGLSWATGLAAPERRCVFTLSWWHDQAAMDATVRGEGDHRAAVGQQAEKDFHHQSAFVRFRPVAVDGALTGRNGIEGLTL